MKAKDLAQILMTHPEAEVFVENGYEHLMFTNVEDLVIDMVDKASDELGQTIEKAWLIK